jgi:hypothetical protein
MKRRSMIWGAGVLACVMAFGATLITLTGCGEEDLTGVPRFFRVVDGTPAVDDGLPGVDWRAPNVNPDDFANNAPVQVDVFRQDTVRKVDILWLVDNSPKMAQAQGTLADNFDAFISDLAQAEPPVNYHLGIVTTDAVTEGGALRALRDAGGSEIPGADSEPLRYIACNDPNLSDVCNVGSATDAETVFRETVQVGIEGTPIERGLLSVQLALSEPNRSGINSGFLRDDAALYVIAISEEDDSSCHQFETDPATSTQIGTHGGRPVYNYEGCNFHPGCRCRGAVGDFGSPDYFVRFFQGLKGYGNQDMVTLAVIAAGDEEPLRLCLNSGCTAYGQFRGCRNAELDIEPIYAPRYIEVATRTGGTHISMCEDNYSDILGDLGFAVSGQRRSFPLSRQPVNPDLTPIGVVMVHADGTAENVPHVDVADEGGWEYIRCESGSFVNAIRFEDPWVPEPGARVQVTYQVNVSGGTGC